MDRSDAAIAATSGDVLTHAEIPASDGSTSAPRPEMSEHATDTREFAAAEASETDAMDMAPMPQAASATPVAPAPVASAPVEASPAILEEIDVAPSIPAHIPTAPAPVEPERVAATPVTVPTAAFEEPPRPAPVEVAVAPPRPEPAPTSAPEMPRPSLDEALRESGLQLIETHPGKAKAVATTEEEAPVTPPAPRARRAPPPDIDQPLQQVETRK